MLYRGGNHSDAVAARLVIEPPTPNHRPESDCGTFTGMVGVYALAACSLTRETRSIYLTPYRT